MILKHVLFVIGAVLLQMTATHLEDRKMAEMSRVFI
jgi:hypothetical protein